MRNINNLRNADDTTLMVESKEELKSLWMKVQEGSEKKWLSTKKIINAYNAKTGIYLKMVKLLIINIYNM